MVLSLRAGGVSRWFRFVARWLWRGVYGFCFLVVMFYGFFLFVVGLEFVRNIFFDILNAHRFIDLNTVYYFFIDSFSALLFLFCGFYIVKRSKGSYWVGVTTLPIFLIYCFMYVFLFHRWGYFLWQAFDRYLSPLLGGCSFISFKLHLLLLTTISYLILYKKRENLSNRKVWWFVWVNA